MWQPQQLPSRVMHTFYTYTAERKIHPPLQLCILCTFTATIGKEESQHQHTSIGLLCSITQPGNLVQDKPLLIERGYVSKARSAVQYMLHCNKLHCWSAVLRKGKQLLSNSSKVHVHVTDIARCYILLLDH